MENVNSEKLKSPENILKRKSVIFSGITPIPRWYTD